MKRRRISARERLAIFEREAGRCHLCGGQVHVGEAWEISHDTPIEMGGADEGGNLKVAHVKCHKDRTKADVEAIARAKRVEARHIGARPKPKQPIKSRGFPGGPKRTPRPSLPPRRLFVPAKTESCP